MCSSDLEVAIGVVASTDAGVLNTLKAMGDQAIQMVNAIVNPAEQKAGQVDALLQDEKVQEALGKMGSDAESGYAGAVGKRSEERRGGKGGRSRGSP